MMEDDDLYEIKAFLRVLQDAWIQGESSEELGHHLFKCAKLLLNPLHMKPPNAESKAKLTANPVNKNGMSFYSVPVPGVPQPVKFGNEPLQIVLNLSKDLHLDEIEAVRVLFRCYEKMRDSGKDASTDSCVQDFLFRNRELRLQALEEILKITVESFKQSIGLSVSGTAQKLKKDGLLGNLCTQIETNASIQSPRFRSQFQQEILAMARIIFLICSHFQLTIEEIQKLLHIIQILAQRALYVPCYTLILAFQKAIDPNEDVLFFNTDVNATRPNALRVGDISPHIEKIFSNDWTVPLDQNPSPNQRRPQQQNEAVKACLRLTWHLHCTDLRNKGHAFENHNYQGEQCLSQGLFTALLTNFIPFFSKANTNEASTYLLILSELTKTMSFTIFHLIIALKNLASVPDADHGCSHFTQFLHVLIRLSSMNPSMIKMSLFSDQVASKTWELLEFIDRQARPDKPLFPVYCKLLSAFSDAAPLDIFQYVSGNGSVFSEKLQLDKLSRLLVKAADMYAVRQNTGTQSRPIKVEVDILVSMLSVIEAIAKPNFISQISDYDLGVETMLKLLRCSFPMRLKGQILRTLTAVIHRPNPSKIWDSLHQEQLLVTDPRLPKGEGVEGDLKRNETMQAKATYPVSAAFCNLIKTLVESGDLPKSLGQPNVHADGILPYIRFVRDKVLMKAFDRQYKDPVDVWTLLRPSLGVVKAVLSKPLSLEPQTMEKNFVAFPQFEMISKLISGREFTDKILHILSNAFHGRPTVAGKPSQDYSDVILLCLEILLLALKIEQPVIRFCQSHYSSQIACRSVRSTLMTKSNDSSLAIIAKCVGYMQSPKIPVAAVRILRILAHEHSSQIAHVFRSVTPDVICECFAEQLSHGNVAEKADQDVRILIIQLILENLDAHDHNLSLILLGLNAANKNFTCLSCIITLTKQTRISATNPELAECCYELFYRLLANQRTAPQFYDLISYHHQSFLIELLQHVVEESERVQLKKGISHILQRAFLLNSLALYLHLSRTRNNRFHDDEVLMQLGMFPNVQNQRNARLIVRCLNGLQHDDKPLLSIGVQQWGLSLQDFEMENDPGCITYDIEKLAYRLRRDQRTNEEVQSITRKVLEVNQSRNYVWALSNVHKAWANLIEVVILEFHIKIEAFDTVLFEILCLVLERLIQSATHQSIYRDCSYPLAAVALAAMKRLRAILTDTDVRISLQECGKLCGLLSRAIIGQASNNATRVPLYGAFLAYFDFCDYRPSYLGAQRQSIQMIENEFTLFEEVVREEYKLIKMNRDVLKQHQPDLIDVVSLDVVSQVPLLATLGSNLLSAIAILSSHPFMEDSKDHSWIFYLARNGRFARLIRGLNAEDEALGEAIYVQGTEKTNIIYKFESVMSFLSQVARAEIGCSQLIDASIFDLFMKAGFIDNKPHTSAGSNGTVHALHRYFQLVNPVLRLIFTMLQTQTSNRSLHRAVFEVLKRHEEAFNGILKDIKSSRLASLEGIHMLLNIWQQLMNGPLNVLQDANSQQLANLQAVMKQRRMWQNLFKNLVHRLQSSEPFTEPMQIQEDVFTRGEDSKEELVEKSFDILRVLVLLFRQSVSHPFQPMEAELIFTLDQDPNIGELLNAISVTGAELDQCLKDQAELKLDSTRIEDALDKYMRDVPVPGTFQSQKLCASQIVQNKLDAVTDRVEKLSTTLELMFTLFFGHCRFYALKDPNGAIQKTLAESVPKINEIAVQLRSIQIDAKKDSIHHFESDFVESLAAQISSLVKKKPHYLEWRQPYRGEIMV